MVQGLDKFKAALAEHHAHYVIIGGMACKLMDEEFRATKDFDIVILTDKPLEEFASALWGLIQEGEYEHLQRGEEERPQFYRFSNPKSKDYPYMLELFCHRPAHFPLPAEAELTYVPIDGSISSLSAILLDEEAYAFIKEGVETAEELPVLQASHIIPLKMLAHTNLTADKAAGKQVDSKHIKKHRNDVFRLLASLTEEQRITLPQLLKNASKSYLSAMKSEVISKDVLKSSGLTQQAALETLTTIYA